MRALKFAAPIGLAAVCIASIAYADKDADIYIKNSTSATKAIDVKVGNSENCDENKSFVKLGWSIPPGGQAHVEVNPPRPKWACFRLVGGPWVKESTKACKKADCTLTIR